MVQNGYTEEDFWNCTPDALHANIEGILRLQAENRVVDFHNTLVAIGSALGGKKGGNVSKDYVKSLRGE